MIPNRRLQEIVRLALHHWPAGRRGHLAAGLAAAGLLCVAAAALWQWRQPPAMAPLLEGRQLRRSEMETLVTALAAADVHQWQCRERQVFVPRHLRSHCLQVVDKAGALPKRSDPQQVAAPHLLDTRQVREQKRQAANELAFVRMIEAMRGIEEARVKLSSHTLEGLQRRVERRALVAVRGVDDLPLSATQLEAIRQLVVGGEAGLQPADVTVTDLNQAAGELNAAGQVPPAPVAGGRVASRTPQTTGRLSEQISQRLSVLDGLQVRVEACPSAGLSAPAVRPAVAVRGGLPAVQVDLLVPSATLNRHFGSGPKGPPLDPQVLTERASQRLQPLIDQLAGGPVRLGVSIDQPPAAESASVHRRGGGATPWKLASLDRKSALWLLGMAGVGLVSMLVRPRTACPDQPSAVAGFAEHANRDPEGLAELLERWSQADDASDFPPGPE